MPATFSTAGYSPGQVQKFLDLEHNDYDYKSLHADGVAGTSDQDLLGYGAENCHVASLPSPERIAYVKANYPIDELASLRKFSMLYSLQALCPQYDSKSVMSDVNGVLNGVIK